MGDITNTFDEVYAEDRHVWRDWLKRNHSKSKGIWLVYYKKQSGKASVSYNDAVEEALCFGWIDSKVNSIDDKRYKQVFTPRNPRSIWSAPNKKRAAKMIRLKKMTAAGREKIALAKQYGSWQALDNADRLIIPDDLKNIFSKNKQASKAYNLLKDSDKKRLIYLIDRAKKTETRNKRIVSVVEMLTDNIRKRTL